MQYCTAICEVYCVFCEIDDLIINAGPMFHHNELNS